MNRRRFMLNSGGCAAHLMSLSFVSPALGRELFLPQQDKNVVVTEKWGRIERIADGIWAHVATPFDSRDFTTVSNGGIIAGKDRVLAIEAYMQPKGATWIAERAKELTGRWPTDVVITHYHGDHASGHRGYFADGHEPKIWLTESTKTNAEKSFSSQGNGTPDDFKNVEVLDAEKPTTLDLGGRTVKLVPRQGHTQSDVSIEISDPKVIWTGDLFFNRMFPNYGDAMPKKLNDYAKYLVSLEDDVTVVPGHGPLANSKAAEKYVEFLSYVEDKAKAAISSGGDVEAAASEFKLPQSLEGWIVWSPDNAKKAFAAWDRELSARK